MMRVRLPEGSRTKRMSLLVDGEKVTLTFDSKGYAKVRDSQGEAVAAAIPALTLVKPEKAKAPKKEEAKVQEEQETE